MEDLAASAALVVSTVVSVEAAGLAVAVLAGHRAEGSVALAAAHPVAAAHPADFK